MILGILLIWILFGVAAAMAATNKGRNSCGWFALGFLLGPFGLIFALLLKPLPATGSHQGIGTIPGPITGPLLPPLDLDSATKQCPACAEDIKLAARKCRFCGQEFDPDRDLEVLQADHARSQEKIKAGLLRCPACGSWDVRDDFPLLPFCLHCRRPIKYDE